MAKAGSILCISDPRAKARSKKRMKYFFPILDSTFKDFIKI